MDNYKVSRKAQIDLIGIWDFTKYKWSKNQANKYLKLLLNKFEFIARNSGVGKPCDYIRNGYFKLPIQSHIVFYIRTSESEIEIIRVLHKSSDIISNFQ